MEVFSRNRKSEALLISPNTLVMKGLAIKFIEAKVGNLPSSTHLKPAHLGNTSISSPCISHNSVQHVVTA